MAPSRCVRIKGKIQKWFDESWGGSLILPDGWYGRPYDNQHQLTSVEQADEELTIVLDRRLTLRFHGLSAVAVQKHELVFGPFRKMTFESEGRDPDEVQVHREYQVGEVKIVAGMQVLGNTERGGDP